MRNSGIDIVGDVPWGTHFCQVYRDAQDLIDTLVPYFKAGLEANEFCMWITSEPFNAQKAKDALAEAVPDLGDHIAGGRIEILDYSQWYTLDSGFDPARIIQGWIGKLEAARKRGFEGLRLSADAIWLEESAWQRFIEYETAIDRIICCHPMLALCTYSLATCGAFEIMDIVGSHAFALIKRNGAWQVIEYEGSKRAGRALHQQREWLRVTLTSIGDAVVATDLGGRVVFSNPAARELIGWPEEELLGRPVGAAFQLINENTREEVDDIVARALREGNTVTLAGNTVLVTRSGREIPVEDSAAPIRDEAGNVAGVVLVLRDVTEERRAQRSLQESEQRSRRKLDTILSPEGDIETLELADIIDVAAIQSLMDDFYSLTRLPMAIIDLKGSILVGVGWRDICTEFHRVHPEACKNCIESDTQLTAGIPPGECRVYKCKNNLWDAATPLTVGGRHVGNLFLGQFFFDDDVVDYELFRSQARRYGFDEQAYLSALEKVPRISREQLNSGMSFLAKLGHMVSLTSFSNLNLARLLAEHEALTASLKESQSRLSRTQEMAHLGSWELDLATNRLSWSDEVYRIFGLQPQEFAATYEAFLEAVHPEDRAAVHDAYTSSVRDGAASYELTHRVVRKSTGEVRFVHQKCEHIRGDDGKIVRSIGMVQDITDRKRAEDALRQAQKLESIGLLAGGIAHDFNNLLTGIMGHASMLAEEAGEETREQVNAILRAAEKAAHLTRQLLAYSGKGQFEIRELDVSQAVQEMGDFVQFSIPKSADLSLNLQKRLPLVQIDPSQFQQIVMNLVINAGEAIGEGNPGRITVSTSMTDIAEAFPDAVGRPVAPGRYVSLEVSDTGCGIAPDKLPSIFDPFFTTKFIGRGLGLSAVAGIVGPCRGGVIVESEPGRGSTFRVLLPAAESRTQAAAGRPGTGYRATILVVDDDAGVREFIASALRRHNYRVLEACDGRDALAVCDREGGGIDGAILDVVMPVMGARYLLPALKARRPDMKVLLTSGYDELEAMRLCAEHPGAAFIQKPYTAHQIAKAIGGLLELSGVGPDVSDAITA
ncbi:MAG: PocR ligand-binding domain-containing protein [Rhodospirillales bacterium]